MLNLTLNYAKILQNGWDFAPWSFLLVDDPFKSSACRKMPSAKLKWDSVHGWTGLVSHTIMSSSSSRAVLQGLMALAHLTPQVLSKVL